MEGSLETQYGPDQITNLAVFALDHLSICMTYFLYSAFKCSSRRKDCKCSTSDYPLGHTCSIVLLYTHIYSCKIIKNNFGQKKVMEDIFKKSNIIKIQNIQYVWV